MTNHIKYVNSTLDHSQTYANDVNDEAIQSAEADLNSLISTFDSMRNIYLADLMKLRDVYSPGFQLILSAIKTKKAELEALTGSEVIFDE